ncbi:MAG: penicillin-binding protein 2 [Actinobacteria bacterium]|nr:penicillin-binding protein 2 [Actinomycetota bacterium]
MKEQSILRLQVFKWFLTALLVTLIARLFFIQVLTGEDYAQLADENRIREVTTLAVRGLILDQAGRPLVENRTSLVITVDRETINELPDNGNEVLSRLATILKKPEQELRDRITPCGATGSAPPPICWNGSPLQPVPVARDVGYKLALKIMEDSLNFPGVAAEVAAERVYPAPLGVNAAHLLGYIGPISAEELADADQASGYKRTSVVGRAGLEKQYDLVLRGVDGKKLLAVDRSGKVVDEIGETQPIPGNYLITALDADLQQVVERELQRAVNRARENNFVADGGAAIVMDVTNGQVLAMASYPSYEPDIWLNGLSNREYKSLISEANGVPLLHRPTQGLYAPASTFKVVMTAAAEKAGMPLTGLYNCSPEVTISSRVFRNNESRAYGPISLARALEVSCNTVFYRIANDLWEQTGKDTMKTGRDPIDKMARSFGLGKITGIDLPSEYAGRIGGRAWKRENWERNKDVWCERAKSGYPETAKRDPVWAETLRQYAAENCADGFLFRAGDAVNIAIGQGDTVVTPLQMAVAYSAIANDGTLFQPQIAKAIMDVDGNVVQEFAPKVTGKLNTSPRVLSYIRAALTNTAISGTTAWVFPGFPLEQVPIASKTGTGQVFNKQSTSWLATFAPAINPRYVVVMMVSQGGTGSGTGGPSVRRIYEALFGIRGSTINPANAIFPYGKPRTKLPTIDINGSPVPEAEAIGRTKP